MQCPYAMHVQARWKDPCHSQICDESEESEWVSEWQREREKERGEKTDSHRKENQCVHVPTTGIIWIIRTHEVTWRGKSRRNWENMPYCIFALNKSLLLMLQVFLLKRLWSEKIQGEIWEQLRLDFECHPVTSCWNPPQHWQHVPSIVMPLLQWHRWLKAIMF